ncbi:16S rRNA processing protein RimM [Methylococcus capsulatus str. Bath]|jgi:16S rRNA processing protein RimM|uniref:Ribosome maturation factor RimM n=1 Tax=Methylococcus capsulatus (strain ATCC 33009 / NCIMB 11132 / Bath) TaxID=243233 RepID=RIMM_METCA|nr:ribosome maturation factor RimM [Methylococcus capsulatus]Q60BS2.1 RecName: Full=Ribosome maturation factor RimM [Methylococcus capsulatus str. Bath]AAU90471.1 16S rRNA processing protein RimM [Methylococcus capsulatus str. Bath]
MPGNSGNDRSVVVGRVSGAFGVRGWVKAVSFTDPPVNLVGYRPWTLRRGDAERRADVLEGREHGNAVIVRLQGVDTREQAEALKGFEVTVRRSQLPPPAPGEYYRVDLVGLKVVNLGETVLGEVVDVMETGANDVLVVQGDRERLLPFVQGVFVKSVNLEESRIVVDWDPGF